MCPFSRSSSTTRLTVVAGIVTALPRESWDNYGMHAERGKETIAHLARMFAGHDTNHVLQVERIAGQVKSARRKKKRK